MATTHAQYSCDACRVRKTQCSREVPTCSRCAEETRDCVYSRWGPIRRVRRSKVTRSLENRDAGSKRTVSPAVDNEHSAALDTPLVEADTTETAPDSVVSSLLTVGTPFWQDTNFIDMANRMRGQSLGTQYFTFEAEKEDWTELFAASMRRGYPFFTPVPDVVLSALATHPEDVREKAHLVLFYGMLMNVNPSRLKASGDVMAKLKWNLWLSINDARLLLEPSDINIQALMLLACHVQSFHTPSLSWMVVASACRMFQAIASPIQRNPSEAEKARWCLFFGFVDSLDTSLALIFGRPPTLHRSMRKAFPLPSMQTFMLFDPIAGPQRGGHRSLFGGHYLRQMFLSPPIVGDVWEFVHGDDSRTTATAARVSRSLNNWYTETNGLLRATMLAETVLMSEDQMAECELGIAFLRFQHLLLTVHLTRGRKESASECVHASQELLLLLPTLEADSESVYSWMVWQVLYCPFTALFTLAAHVAADCRAPSVPAAMRAMATLPRFLQLMTDKHPLAASLLELATRLLDEVERMVATGDVQTADRAVRTGRHFMGLPSPAPVPEGVQMATPDSTARASQPSTVGPDADLRSHFLRGPATTEGGRPGPAAESPADMWTGTDDFDWFQWDLADANPFFGAV